MRLLAAPFTIATLLALLSTASAQPVTLGPGSEPRLAVEADGTLSIAYGRDKGVFVHTSTDAGATWSPARRVESLTGVMPLGMRRGPRLVAAGDALVVTAVSGEQGGGKDGDVVAVRSTDGGQIWSKPVIVSDKPGAAREGLQDLAASPDGKHLLAAWLDDRDGGKTVMAATSGDGGLTWSANTLVYRSPDGHVCECCHPSALIDADGHAFVMFRNWLGGSRDLYLARSDDLGQTWRAPVKLGRGTWKLNACPMDGGAIAIGADDVVHATFQRDGRVFAADVADERASVVDETPLADNAKQPVLAVTSAGIWRAWLGGGKLMLQSTGDPAPRERAPQATDPVLLAHGVHVWCAWEQGKQIVVSRVR